MVSLNEGNNFLSCMSVKMSLLVTELAFPRKWLLIDSTFHSTRRCKSSSSRPIFFWKFHLHVAISQKKSFSSKMNHNLSRLWFSLIFSGQFYGISQKRLKSTLRSHQLQQKRFHSSLHFLVLPTVTNRQIKIFSVASAHRNEEM